MKVISKTDVDGISEGRTLYALELDDGAEVYVMRGHLTGLARVVGPCPEDVDKAGVLSFLRHGKYAADFETPVWERRRRYSHSTVWDACYSPEQAFLLADKCWAEDMHRDDYSLFRIRTGGKVLKDYLAGA